MIDLIFQHTDAMTLNKSTTFSSSGRDSERINHVVGILWFMGSGFLSVCINTLMRVLTTDFHYHPLQLVFFYSIMGAAMYLPHVLRHRADYRLERPRLYVARALLEIGGFTLVFYSLTLLHFATMTVLMFTVPIIGALAAVWLLGESMTRNKWLGLLLGFGGICVVANPDVNALQWAVILPLGASLCFAFCAVCIRKLASSGQAPSKIAFTTLTLMALLSSPLALTHWHTPDVADTPYLLLLAVMVGAVQFCVGQALQKIPLTTAQPFMFFNLIWSSLIGFVLFDESVALATFLGSCLIVSGVALSVRRDSNAGGGIQGTITSPPVM
jgi:drug/metabolite transporter (DMT)-like permease